MNNLPDDILNKIYECKHQLEFKDVTNELIEHKIHCKYNFAIDALKYMFYVNNDGVRISCLDISSINVFAYEILNEIKNKNNKKII
tara:strand:+ start:295 stop:552 length:258 start_codon:yes stop_codon:yes gene_type:complete